MQIEVKWRRSLPDTDTITSQPDPRPGVVGAAGPVATSSALPQVMPRFAFCLCLAL